MPLLHGERRQAADWFTTAWQTPDRATACIGRLEAVILIGLYKETAATDLVMAPVRHTETALTGQ